MINNELLKCSNCGGVLYPEDKFCTSCGHKVEVNQNVKVRVLPTSFDPMYSLSENKLLEEFIKRKLKEVNIDEKSKLIPKDILKRKNIFNIMFSILLFIYISLIFFHFPIITYIIGLILLIVFFKVTRKYDLVKYLIKQVKSRPSEKVTNIIKYILTL